MGRKFQRSFLDFVPKVTPSDNKKGYKVKYLYKGAIYQSPISKSANNKIKLSYAILSVLLIAICIFAMSRYVPSNRSVLVMVPASLGLLTISYTFMGVFSLITSGQALPAWKYLAMNRRLKWGSGLSFSAFSFVFIMDIIYQVFLSKEFIWEEIPICLGYLLCAAISLTIYLSWKKIKYQNTEPSEEVIKAKEDFNDLIEVHKKNNRTKY